MEKKHSSSKTKNVFVSLFQKWRTYTLFLDQRYICCSMKVWDSEPIPEVKKMSALINDWENINVHREQSRPSEARHFGSFHNVNSFCVSGRGGGWGGCSHSHRKVLQLIPSHKQNLQLLNWHKIVTLEYNHFFLEIWRCNFKLAPRCPRHQFPNSSEFRKIWKYNLG